MPYPFIPSPQGRDKMYKGAAPPYHPALRNTGQIECTQLIMSFNMVTRGVGKLG